MNVWKPCLALAAAALVALTGCTENASSDSGGDSDARTVTVSSTDSACDVSATESPAGTLTFNVTNDGSDVTEFYLLGEDGLRIQGEVENIGPGLSRKLTVAAPEGDYVTACKPGMKGEGIRADFTVTASDEDPALTNADGLAKQASTNYSAYVKDQTQQLVAKTDKFAAAYKAGNDDKARELYPEARVHWERIETVAESFGDLDPKTDAREADLEPGQKWTGWHKLEKDLWPPDTGYQALSKSQRATFADDLVDNIATLQKRVNQTESYALDEIANGSRGLLEEVAVGKITGEEEAWSHTDLWDFQANVDGAKVAFEGVRPILEERDADLADQLDERFAELQKLLDAQRDGDGFVLYTDLTQAEIKELSDAVNALSEPLSKLTAVVLG